MSKSKLSLSDLKRCVEQQAYAYGVSDVVCTLLGEYVKELIIQSYVRGKKEHLVSDVAR